MTADIYFRAEGLCVGYGGKTLIRDMDFRVERGEILTLIGPNGAGKSTILKSITGQLGILGGAVYIGGRSAQDMSAKEMAKTLSVVLTERLRPELMSCRDVVAIGRYPYTGMFGRLSAEDERIVEESMAAVHALDLADRDFNAVSDGQRQRVLLARAICQQPEMIVLDEPTSFLDIKYKLELLGLLRQLAKHRKITVVMSLHEIDLAQKVSDKIICIKGEYIYKYGAPSDVFDEETIRDLYDLEQGSYDVNFGSIELGRPSGKADILVLSSAGRGIPVYRHLQKKDRAFYAAVVYKNDTDYAVAKRLAQEVVCAEAFEPVSDEAVARAMALVDECRVVIDAGLIIGTQNAAMRKVLEYARRQGKLRSRDRSMHG